MRNFRKAGMRKKKQTILWAPEPHLSQLFQTLSFWLYELVKNLVKKKRFTRANTESHGIKTCENL